MAVLERGGNAFDAACAAGFVLQVVEPHLNGPGATCRPSSGRPSPASRSSSAPRASRRRPRRSRRFAHAGICSCREPVLERPACPARSAAGSCCSSSSGRGRSLRCSRTRSPTPSRATRLRTRITDDDRASPSLVEWPGLGRALSPPPEAGLDVPQPQLAATWRRLLAESAGTIEGARRVYYEGFIAEEIDRFSREHNGFLTGRTCPAGRPRSNRPRRSTIADHGLQDRCLGPGPRRAVQQLSCRRLRHGVALNEVELVHVLTEAAKLAFAEQDANYGDVEVPTYDHLLSKEYAADRRALIGDEASAQVAGRGPGPAPSTRGDPTVAGLGAGEPTRGHIAFISSRTRPTASATC